MIDRRRLYEEVLDQILAYAERQQLTVGDRLPSERELAERLGVSRNSVKQAMMVLEVQGLVETRHGGGTYLRTGSLVAERISELVGRKQRLPDVLEAREALEVKLVELAASRRTEADVAAMQEALDQMTRSVAEGGTGEEGDRRFHHAVAAASQSALLVDFYRQLSSKIIETRRESLKQPGRPRRSLAQHEQILDAVRAGDARRARTAMSRHLRSVSRVRLLEWNPDL